MCVMGFHAITFKCNTFISRPIMSWTKLDIKWMSSFKGCISIKYECKSF